MANNSNLPSNVMKGTHDLPIRHAIDFSGVSNPDKVKFPEELLQYREVLLNPKRNRISFLTGRLTYYVSRAQWFGKDTIYKKGDFISIDPNIDKFNEIFIKANPNLIYYDSKEPNKIPEIKTYDFLDKGDERSGAINSLINFKNDMNAIGKHTGKIILAVSIVIVGVASFAIYKKITR